MSDSMVTRLVSRLLAVALLFVVLAGGYGLILDPALARFAADRAAVASLHRLLADYRGRGADATAANAVMDPAAAAFLIESSEGQANAALQERTKALVAASGAVVTSVQALPAESGEGLQRIPVRVKLSADTAGLFALLHALESERPVLLIDNVTIGARTSQAVGAGRNLDVQFDVVGFRPLAAGAQPAGFR